MLEALLEQHPLVIQSIMGAKKRKAIMKLLEGNVTAEWPITKLLHHSNLTVITDIDI